MKDKDVAQAAQERGEIIMLEDGRFYYWQGHDGCLAAHELRALADELDRRNAEYDHHLADALRDRAEENP